MDARQKKKIKLLIIDDEKEICKYEKGMFEKHNFEVYTAQTGASALRQAASIKPDMALIDIHMAKGMSGLDILRRLLKAHSACRCVMATWDKEKALEAKKIGAVDFLIKPFELKDLANTIKKAAKSLNKK